MSLLIDDAYQHPQKKVWMGEWKKKKDVILQHLCFEETNLEPSSISAGIQVL